MGDGASQSGDRSALRQTIDRLEETAEIEAEFDRDSVRDTYRQAREERDDIEDSDDFLEYLYETEVIDQETYIAAAEEDEIFVEAPEFEELPPREAFYERYGQIDEGGMGKICVAEDPHLERSVALKILRDDKADAEIERQRFLREAQVTAKLAHPNIVPVHSLHAEGDKSASFSMKLVDGETLFDVIQEAREHAESGEPLVDDLDIRRRIDLFLRVCDAVAFAHDRGVIHRDLKPSNVMVGAYNEVYVMDWGIAKILDQPPEHEEEVWEDAWEQIDADDEVETRAGSLVGTPPYMPPEQARGEHESIGVRSDLYSLGAILFELVTLERMVPGDKVHEVLQNAQVGQRAAFEAYAPGESVDRELGAIVQRATAVDPEHRYPSVDVLADEVRRYLDNREVRAHPDGPLRKITRWMSHNRDIALAGGFAVFMIAAAATMWSLWQQKQAVEASREREAQISRLQAEVSNRAHRIDRQFLRFELLVRRLAISARDLLDDDPAYDGPIYSSEDFDDPETAPPDLAEAPVYGKPISVSTPVFKLAPGVDLDRVRPTIRKLMPLRTRFRSMFLDSRLHSDQPVTSDDAYRELVAVEGVPGRWAFVGLESGLHLAYPGKGGYPPDYDPRERPWYRAGRDDSRVGWAAPYPDAQGQGLVLPCVAPIRTDDGDLLGIAGFEVTLDFVKEAFMKTSGPLAATFVLDGDGETLVASEDSEFGSASDRARRSIEEMIRNQRSGIYTTGDEPTDVYAVYRMPTLGWFYVARAPLPQLLDWKRASDGGE